MFANFRVGLYSLVWGQCTDALQECLKSHHDYQAASQDGIALLVIIQSLIHTFEENRKLSDAIMDVKEKFYKFYQGRHMTLERYHELFLAQVEVLDEVSITIEDDALVMEVAGQNGRVEPNDDDYSEARSQELAIRFIWELTHTIKDTCAICRIHTWMEATTTPELFMRHTTSSKDMKRKHQSMALKVMVCHLHKVGSGRTHQIFGVIVVNKWDTTRTHQNVPTINQVKTKTTNQAMGTAAGPHKVGVV